MLYNRTVKGKTVAKILHFAILSIIMSERGKPLTSEQVVAMEVAYLETPHIRTVAKKMAVSERTVYHWRRKLHWDERLAEIRQKAQRKADDSFAARLASKQQLLQTAYKVYTAALLGKIPAKCQHCGEQAICQKCNTPVVVIIPKAMPNFGDLEKLVRIEVLLFGQVGGLDAEPKRIRYPLIPAQEKKSVDEFR